VAESGVIDFDIPDIIVVDESPVGEDFEYACEVCGTELFYGGRGRKPKYCDEHKGGKRKDGTVGATRKGGNDRAARQAADALMQINSLLGMAMLTPWVNLPMTASALAVANEPFGDQAFEALKTDPALCRMILRAGTTSGKAALVIAYGMLAFAISPVAAMEVKTRNGTVT
jgi:hypothetical protein